MEWVLFVSLQWVVLGSPTQPNTQQIQSFSSEELCKKAAEAIRNEINEPIPGQRVQTLGRVVCLLRKDK
jgi:methionine aminopeptidase